MTRRREKKWKRHKYIPNAWVVLRPWSLVNLVGGTWKASPQVYPGTPMEKAVGIPGGASLGSAIPTCMRKAETHLLGCWVMDVRIPALQQLATCIELGAAGRRSMITGSFSQQCGATLPLKKEQFPCSIASAPNIFHITSLPPHLQLSFHPGSSICRNSW